MRMLQYIRSEKIKTSMIFVSWGIPKGTVSEWVKKSGKILEERIHANTINIKTLALTKYLGYGKAH